MVRHLHPNFLENTEDYALAEGYWIDLWEHIDANLRGRNGWEHPWFHPLPPSISEGNPIFSAVSPRLKRGIRIIQSAPTDKDLEFIAYLDTFGGMISDADSIHELVISCALSDLAAKTALSLIIPWIEGRDVSFDLPEDDPIAKSDMPEAFVPLSEPKGEGITMLFHEASNRKIQENPAKDQTSGS